MELVLYPDPFLRRRTAPIPVIDDEVREKIGEMFSILYREKGIGLAAPQVGWGARLFIANVTGEPDPKEERVYINPRIISTDGEVREEEGCLSIPSIRGVVTRGRRAVVRAQNLQGEIFEEDADELRARVIQHEYDHLDGILFISRLSAADRFLVNRQLKKLEKERAERTVRVR
jgi:peptide deformylase